MRHVAGMHKADAFRERKISGPWKMRAVTVAALVTAGMVVAGAVLAGVANGDHKDVVFDWSDAVNHAWALCLVAGGWVIYRVNHRANRAVMRGIRAANAAAGLPDPEEPAAMDRKAA